MTKKLQLSHYARIKYKVTEPVDFDVAVNYSAALLAIAGADGELADSEMAWYINEQRLLLEDSDAYIEAIRNIDWRNVNVEKTLSDVRYDFPVNFRHGILYDAIKMCSADGEYHVKEKAAVKKAAQTLGVAPDVLTNLEALAKMEAAADELRCSLVGTSI